jgi:hypothetical protein
MVFRSISQRMARAIAKGGSIVSVSAGDRIGASFSPGMKMARRASPAVTRWGAILALAVLGAAGAEKFLAL